MSIIQAAEQLRHDVPVAEISIDDALIAVSTLVSSMVAARRHVNVPAIRSQAAISRLVKVQQSLVAASGDVLRVHGELTEIGREHAGLDVHECPAMAVAKPHLAAVA
jgi:hypothetical protein